MVLPVGDVICSGTSPVGRLWWVNPDDLAELRKVCAPFKGFILHTGARGRGTSYMPEVITYEEQERKVNGEYARNCRMQDALIGYVLVWFEISDIHAARTTLESRTDVPVGLRFDLAQYSDDPDYQSVCDVYEQYFVHYVTTGKPYSLHDVDMDDPETIRELYDV